MNNFVVLICSRCGEAMEIERAYLYKLGLPGQLAIVIKPCELCSEKEKEKEDDQV